MFNNKNPRGEGEVGGGGRKRKSGGLYLCIGALKVSHTMDDISEDSVRMHLQVNGNMYRTHAVNRHASSLSLCVRTLKWPGQQHACFLFQSHAIC